MSAIRSSLYFEPSLFGQEPKHQEPSALVLGESVFDKFTNHPIKQEYLFAADESTLFDEHQSDNVDFNAGTTSSTVDLGTISPLDIHSSLIESVFNITELDDSPMFDQGLDLGLKQEEDEWVSLFNESELQLQVDESDAGLNKKRCFEEVEQETQPQQQTITPLDTPNLDQDKLEPKKRCKSIDELGVVSYSRKQRSIQLSPVVVEDESDPIAAKRARNTEAARRSRARKMERMSQLEDKVEMLLNRNSDLEQEVERLRAMLGQQLK